MTGKHVRRSSNAMKDCYFCKGRVIEQKVKVDFRWGHKLKIIENVPADVCQQCGEAVCGSHAVKSEFYLPSVNGNLPKGNRVLTPLLCEDCYSELKKLRTSV